MNVEDVQALLEQGLENCQVQVQGDGSHFNVLAVGEAFAGLRPVRRQQLVYAALSARIADGSIHAVNIRALTPAEQAAAEG